MDGLEGYARTFLLAAYRLAGAGGQVSGDLVERYLSGLQAGTDPASDEMWPVPSDHSQAIVEAASIAIALYETRRWIWSHLPEAAKQHVVTWLLAAANARVWPNNWLLFPVVIHTFLKSVGAPYRQGIIERHLRAVEKLYRGEGWYSDGGRHNFDYYNGWAFHFYLYHCSRMERHDSPSAKNHRERLRLYLAQHQYLFAEDGAPIYHGRSLTYRFAVLAPLWAGALWKSVGLMPGVLRCMANKTLLYFLHRGVLAD